MPLPQAKSSCSSHLSDFWVTVQHLSLLTDFSLALPVSLGVQHKIRTHPLALQRRSR